MTGHCPSATIVLSVEDLQSLKETLAVLSRPALLAEIREASTGREAARAFSYDEDIRFATGR